MARKAGDECRFRQRDLKEAIKAARAAGLENFRVDVGRDGTISVVPMARGENAQEGTQWDKLLKDDD
jgi:hypothetical protein